MPKPLSAALAALTLAAAQPAVAEPWTILIYETEAELALRTDPSEAGAAYWGAYAAYGKALADAGVLRGGAALDPAAVLTVSPAGTGERPLAAAPLALGGYFQIDVPDRAAALGWAAKAPAAATGAVELRKGFPAPGM
jgi:hypothetical protein